VWADLSIALEANWLAQALLAAGAVLIPYLLGHAVASFSSAMIDRLLVNRMFGYPYEHLFQAVLPVNDLKKTKRAFYKAIGWFLGLFLISSAVLGAGDRISALLACLTVLFFLAKLAYSALRHQSRSQNRRIRSLAVAIQSVLRPAWTYGVKSIVVVCAALVDIFANLVFSLFKMHDRFPEKFQHAFQEKFKSQFGLTMSEAETNIYWLSYVYLCETSKNTMPHTLH
jgi:hypothetical protein